MEKITYSLRTIENRIAFKNGLRDGIPIALGYFAVAFSLGIMAKHSGLSPFQGFLTSALCLASAGEYVGFTLIAAAATFLEIAVATLVTNARYLLMSCALSQRMGPKMPLRHRLGTAFFITDEIFGITIARQGFLNPYYTYGAGAIAAPAWALGTMIGVIAGNILPLRLVSAFSVALYGMFLAIIIPPAKTDKIIGVLVIIGFALSYAAAYIPFISDFSSGTRTIILTVVISAAAAAFFPKKDDKEEAAQ